MGPRRLYIGFLVLALAIQVKCQEDDEKKKEGGCDGDDLEPLNGTDNGISALEIKIETEQAQESFNDQLERIINLADQMIQEVQDAHGELATAGPDVEMDAMQGRDYVVTHSAIIKTTAFGLWGSGKNITKMIEDAAEKIMTQDATNSLPIPTEGPEKEGEEGGEEEAEEEGGEEEGGEEEGGEEGGEETRARRQTEEGGEEGGEGGEGEGDSGDDDSAGEDVEVEAAEGGNATEAEGNSTAADPVPVGPPIDVKGEADKITEWTTSLSKDYREGLNSIIDETNRMKIIYSFQVFNIQNHGEATSETKEDSDDTLGELTVFADKILDTVQQLLESSNTTYGFILKTSAKIA